MARIRTIKPEFFRHEGLQDLEAANPGAYVMLVFAGLWGHCDKAGRFEWKPRTLKLDILPFLDFDMAATLEILARAGQVRRYESNGKQYGVIESFADHQRIGGKEAQEDAKHPEPTECFTDASPVEAGKETGEATGKQRGLQEGKGRGRGNGREREQEGNGIVTPGDSPADPSPETLVWKSYCFAYAQRYGVEPVCNAKVRSQIAQLCKRIPQGEAADVAAFYVEHGKAFYVQTGHAIGPLLQDCESLRTQWATRRRISETQARQSDATQARGDVFRQLIEEHGNA